MDWNNLGGLVWLLAFGALFYWMMRKGGCGVHTGRSHELGHGHGGPGAEGGGHSGQMPRESEQDRDPVCGMPVDPAHAAGTRISMGQTFHLCSKECLEKFDRDPTTNAHRAIEDSSRSGSRRHACC